MEAGHLNAVAFWYDLHLDEETSITTAPAYVGLGGQPLAAGGTPLDGSMPGGGGGDANPLRTKGRAALQRMGAPEPDQDLIPAPPASAAGDFQPAVVRTGILCLSVASAVFLSLPAMEEFSVTKF